MGFCFNRQRHMMFAIRESMKNHKSTPLTQSKVTRHPDVRTKRHCQQQQHQLTAEDYSFLQSIGLKVRKFPSNDDEC